ncbi:hypothetical protein K440DRAFT_416549 [Wilcoxina mikolae CBS 423.85]|nr:hypothetical protein K440DRAFT_416549 [Wilcoxina mikolae CBS 423.85]
MARHHICKNGWSFHLYTVLGGSSGFCFSFSCLLYPEYVCATSTGLERDSWFLLNEIFVCISRTRRRVSTRQEIDEMDDGPLTGSSEQ